MFFPSSFILKRKTFVSHLIILAHYHTIILMEYPLIIANKNKSGGLNSHRSYTNILYIESTSKIRQAKGTQKKITSDKIKT